MTDARVSFRDQPGWTAISAAGLHVLVRGNGDAEQVRLVRESARSGELDDVLDALSRGGVRQAPDFVAVQEADPLRVVARGSAYAEVSAAAGESQIRAARRGPWADEDAPEGTTAVVLHSGEPQPEPEPKPQPEPEPTPQAEPPAPLQSDAGRGWKLPSRLGRASAAHESSGPKSSVPESSAPEASAPALGPEGVPEEVDELPSYDHLFGATQQGLPQYIEDHDTSNISEPPIGHAPIEAAGGFTPTGASENSDHTLPPPSDTQKGSAASTDRSAGSRSAPKPAPEPAQPIAPPSPGALIDSVPWRSGGSNVPPPETPRPPAARKGGVRTPPPAPTLRPAVPSQPAPAQTPPAPSQTPPPPEPPAAPTPATAPDTAKPAAGPASAAADAGADEATVDRSALLAQTGADRPEAGPMVLAVLCPAGHPSSPHAGKCRVCERDIPAQQPFQTPRPALGVLRLSTGDVVSLDRGVLLGRSPKLKSELPVAERPHLVRVASPENDISRNHVEVVLEGWHVLVRDLGSTNGTTVALPGQVPVRLRPSDQQVIEAGTVVTLADEVSFTFEVSA